MQTEQSLTDERMLVDLETEVRPLVETIRTDLACLMTASGQETVEKFFAIAPVEACVRLADAWALAVAVGLDMDTFRDRFDPEAQFLIDLVTSIYTDSLSAHAGILCDLHELTRLIDDSEFDTASE